MRREALFLNGIYETVLQDILMIQSELPEQIMFLQPYSSRTMIQLRDAPPTVDDPMGLFLSLTTDVNTVWYVAEIVGWDDKRSLPEKKRDPLNRLIWTLQPREGGLYNASRAEGESANLLHVRRLRKVAISFNVTVFVKTRDGEHPGERNRPGGWVYVENRPA